MAKHGEKYELLKMLVLVFLEDNRMDYAPTHDEFAALDESGDIIRLMDETNAVSFDLWADLELEERTSEAVLYSMIMRTMFKEGINYIPTAQQIMKHEYEGMLYILEIGDIVSFAKSKGLYTYDQIISMKGRKK